MYVNADPLAEMKSIRIGDSDMYDCKVIARNNRSEEQDLESYCYIILLGIKFSMKMVKSTSLRDFQYHALSHRPHNQTPKQMYSVLPMISFHSVQRKYTKVVKWIISNVNQMQFLSQ